ncbi:hypothetical protein [Loigolactobacillus backii]|nr:hypothetical protein [Loigolactobacillus backii]ANK66600.1 hypothetical protein AYR55_02150 [Loigolactobacillus backii]OLF70820.1 hypothetical protein ACX53_00415 [Loigolactobacillus backii]PIO87310.1 hypothetical protein B8A32_09295 [Loigolactobacillus backii]
MTLTKIFSGMEKWSEAINDNFQQIITKVPWTSDGIVYKNGWTQFTDNELVYTYGSFGANNFIAVGGQISYPNIPASQFSVTPFALPISVFNGQKNWAVSPVIANFDGNLYRPFPDTSTGDINLRRTTNTALTANTMVINFIMIH